MTPLLEELIVLGISSLLEVLPSVHNLSIRTSLLILLSVHTLGRITPLFKKNNKYLVPKSVYLLEICSKFFSKL